MPVSQVARDIASGPPAATNSSCSRPGQGSPTTPPLAGTPDEPHGIVAAQQVTGRKAGVDMYSRFSLASQQPGQAATG